jgi:hypothetical protein
LKRPRIFRTLATAGRSRTAGAPDTVANTSAITPPPRRPISRPAFRIRIDNEPEATLLL